MTDLIQRLDAVGVAMYPAHGTGLVTIVLPKGPTVQPMQICQEAAAELRRCHDRIAALEAQLADERMEHDLLKGLLARPEIDSFYEGVMLEAAHQVQRWGAAHDRDKSAENWFWLVGYLSGKALRAAIEGDVNKARHHTISTAAALFQWHRVMNVQANGVGADLDIAPTDLIAKEGGNG